MHPWQAGVGGRGSSVVLRGTVIQSGEPQGPNAWNVRVGTSDVPHSIASVVPPAAQLQQLLVTP